MSDNFREKMGLHKSKGKVKRQQIVQNSLFVVHMLFFFFLHECRYFCYPVAVVAHQFLECNFHEMR